MTYETEVYREEIACLDLPREQEDQLLFTLCGIMWTMVELGWDIENIHRLIPDLFENTDLSDVNMPR